MGSPAERPDDVLLPTGHDPSLGAVATVPEGRLLRGMILAACCYGMMTISFVNASHAFLIPSIAAGLGLDEAAKGLFLSCAFWGMVVSILGAGTLADRYGYRKLLVLSALCQSVGLLMIGSLSSLPLMYAGVCIASIGTRTVLTVAMPAAFALHSRSRHAISNVLAGFCGIGAVIIIVLDLVLLKSTWGWWTIYRLVALLVVPYGLAFLFLPLPTSACQNGAWLKGWELIRRKSFGLLLVGIFLITFIRVGVGLWLPKLR